MLKPETTGIGSLPLTDPDAAVAHVFSSYTIPFLPQLVQHARYKAATAPQMLQEAVPAAILQQLLAGDVVDPVLLRTRWLSDLDAHLNSLPALPEFLRRLESHRRSHFKLQLCGPLTAAKILRHLTGTTPGTDILTIMTELIIETARRMITRALKVTTASCLFIWDEGLPLTEPSPEYARSLGTLLTSVASDRVQTGVHCCAPFDPRTFFSYAQGHWLAADMTMLNLSDTEVLSSLAEIHASGGLIAGIVDTHTSEVSAGHSGRLFDRLKDINQRGDQRHFMISGGCGTGLRTVKYEMDMVRALDIHR